LNGEIMHGHTVANGGGTFRPTADCDGHPIAYDSGFQVGLGGVEGAPLFEVSNPAPLMYALLAVWVRYAAPAFGPIAVGSWIDDGITYIEPSVWIENRNEALALGRRLGEQSVLEWATFDCVPCDDDDGGACGCHCAECYALFGCDGFGDYCRDCPGDDGGGCDCDCDCGCCGPDCFGDCGCGGDGPCDGAT